MSILRELLVIASTGEVEAGNLKLRFSMMWLILKACNWVSSSQDRVLMEKGETGDLSPREGQCQMFGGEEGSSQGD